MGLTPLLRRSDVLFALRGLFGALLVTLSAVGCVPDETPPLLSLDQVGPSTLESGSELSILGSGFPERRAGKLTLVGTVYSPARAPRSVTFELPLTAESGSSIHIPLRERALTQFLESAPHGTFRGKARVEFAPLVQNRPTLVGEKHELVLDVFSRSKVAEKESSQFLAFLGLGLSDDLVVTEILAGSVAERAGLSLGDKLHELDGVRLGSRADFLPQAQGHTSLAVYSRTGTQGLSEAHLNRQDFQVLDHGVGARAVATLVGLVLALLLAARPPRFVVWMLGKRGSGRKKESPWLAEVPRHFEVFAYPSFLLVTLGLFALLETESELLRDAALIAVLSLGLLLLCFSAFLLGGRGAVTGRFSLTRALSATLLRASLLIPYVLCVLCRAGDMGTLRLGELHALQGFGLTEAGGLSSPWSFLLALSALLCLVPLSGRRAPVEGHVTRAGAALVTARVVEWTGELALLGLWVLLFLGSNNTSAFWLSGLLLSAKMALLAQGLSWLRARTGYVRLAESWSLFGFANIAVSLGLAVLSFGLTVAGITESQSELYRVLALALAVASALLLLIVSQRSFAHVGRKTDPWI